MKKIVYTNASGGAAVTSIPLDFIRKLSRDNEVDMDAAEWLAIDIVLAKDSPLGSSDVAVVDESTLTLDRKFRNAWENAGGNLSVNMPQARVIHMDRIRVALDAELTATNNALSIAEDEIPPDGAEIARLRALRGTLRDIPQTFDLSGAATPEALDALWPTELPARP